MSRLPPAAEAIATLFWKRERVLVALSGGGDSVALLHILHEAGLTLAAATVDHGWRDEAKEEQALAAALCTSLGLAHQVLELEKPPTSQEKARIARYDALTAHACATGCTTIAIGHTADDQRETLAMRAARLLPESSARGLAGIAPLASHAVTPHQRVRLARPLLEERRSALRFWLQARSIAWADDPTNEDKRFERVRRRQAGGAQTSAAHRLANLAQKDRAWLAARVAEHLRQHASKDGDVLILARNTAPSLVERDALAMLILAQGGMPYRASPTKLNACLETTAGQHTLGRCLVTLNAATIRVEREARNASPPPKPGTLYDERFYVESDGNLTPFVAAMERFRPLSDDPLHAALMALLQK
jgi:tRNA(Ile)-lysidine synthase